MTAETLSCAQSLRMIGQDLDGLGLKSFVLARRGDEYFVWVERGQSTREISGENTLFREIVRRLLGRDASATEMPNPLCFASAEILSADAARRSKRITSHGASDLRDVSLVLRVLGDYLDQRAAGDFAISWSTNSVKVSYDQTEDNFTWQNLYDLGVHMYLKRSNRVRAKAYSIRPAPNALGLGWRSQEQY